MNSFPSGNVCKYYIYQHIKKMLGEYQGGRVVTIVDMGCGNGGQWTWLYNSDWKDKVNFYGFDIDKGAIKSAQTKMKEWTFYNESAYEMERYVTDADIITSLSALEHVYKRKKFLRSAKAVLREGGKFFLNYDNGHFLSKSLGEKKRNLIGPYLARLGWENWYQSFVWQNEIIKYLEDLNFIIIEELNFHQATTKSFHRVISDTISKQYHDLWLKYELEINALLKADKTSLNQANSNRFLLAKLFVLTV